MSNGDSNYTASSLELYAQDVFSRVAEIDNAFKNMRITIEYLRKTAYRDSSYNFSEHHAFHIENFLLRLTSVVDRSYLLAGSTMGLENNKIEKIGGNSKVSKELLSFSPKSYSILKNMEKEIDPLRAPRNKVAHQSGFSSKKISVLQTIENAELESISVKQITDLISYDEIKDVVIDESIEQYEKVLLTIDNLVKELIDSLSFVYVDLLKST
ncbi:MULTISPECIES: Cthe_2314 family HEPN domain-containing protein [unclassified Neptuniibacter]|uniref:Cthe_2314 family HEPN domain-containing protein n=1 Tax=unclassified Neptuniibacter TaxID=2630693 RepID=UPI0025CEC495|nr:MULTISPECIES: Cthe_2314 family HEPN domain-containing protein [unclassified Neptuniibacter]